MKALPPLKGGWCCSSTDRSFGRAESQSVQPGQGSPSQASLQLFKQNYLEILKKKTKTVSPSLQFVQSIVRAFVYLTCDEVTHLYLTSP